MKLFDGEFHHRYEAWRWGNGVGGIGESFLNVRAMLPAELAGLNDQTFDSEICSNEKDPALRVCMEWARLNCSVNYIGEHGCVSESAG